MRSSPTGPRAAATGESPIVTVVVAVLNEEHALVACLESIRAQEYLPERVEVLIVDGGSTDGSLHIAAAAAAAGPAIRVIHNPRRIQAAGFNLGVAAGRGEMIALASAHTVFQPSYIATCVRLMASSGADNVGGGQAARGVSRFGRAVAAAYGSPFGIGAARHHYATLAGATDTVFPGFFRREVFDRIGGFDESLAVHEDYEFNRRIRRAGGIVFYSPEIKTPYNVRERPRALARQFFRYGRAKGSVARGARDVLRPHHLVPPLMTATFAVLLPLSTRSATARRALAGLALAYGGFLGAATVVAGKELDGDARSLLPAALATMHFSWGSGFLVGVMSPSPGRPGTTAG